VHSLTRRSNAVWTSWMLLIQQRCSRWDVRPRTRHSPRRPPQRRLPLLLQSSLLIHCHVRIARVGVLKLISRRARTMAATMLTLEMPRLFIVWIRSWLVVRAVVWPAALRWALMIRRNNVVLIFWTASITQRCCRWDVRRPLRPRRRRRRRPRQLPLPYVPIARAGMHRRISRRALVLMNASIPTMELPRGSVVMMTLALQARYSLYFILVMLGTVVWEQPSLTAFCSTTSLIRRNNVVLMFWTASTTPRCSRWDVGITLSPHRRPHRLPLPHVPIARAGTHRHLLIIALHRMTVGLEYTRMKLERKLGCSAASWVLLLDFAKVALIKPPRIVYQL